MKRILLPTDFSKISVNAIHYALQLFKDEACEFFLLNVFRIPYIANDELLSNDVSQLVILEGELHEASKKGMKDLIAELPKNDKHKFRTISDYNLFINAVKQTVEEKKIDLIVMGTKGATGAKEIFMGSNTGDVILKTSCDVIAVPENSKFKSLKEITFPTDFRIKYERLDLAALLKLAERYDAAIRVLHFSEKDALDEEQTNNKKLLSSFLEKVNHSFHTLTNTDFEESVNCFTQSRGDVDMIAMVALHYSFFQRMFFRPKVRELSFHTQIPLFVMHYLKE